MLSLLVFNRVYRLEIQSVMLVSSTGFVYRTTVFKTLYKENLILTSLERLRLELQFQHHKISQTEDGRTLFLSYFIITKMQVHCVKMYTLTLFKKIGEHFPYKYGKFRGDRVQSHV